MRNSLKISPNLLALLKTLDWPGNVSQLKAVITTVISISDKLISANSPSAKTHELPTELNSDEALCANLILDEKERWERYKLNDSSNISSLKARRSLDIANGNFRIAAAKLGTSIQNLYELVNSNQMEQSK